MIHRYLGDYNNFSCIADKCPATCCSGWLIEIDDDSLERYRKDQGPLREDFQNRIDWAGHSFKQQPNGDCAFLRADGLCHMQKNLGEDALCITCAGFPRHTEEFPNIREHSLSMSCPEVSRQLVEGIASGKTNILTWSADENDGLGDSQSYDDFDDELFELLEASRTIVLTILRRDNIPFSVRCQLIGLMMNEIQNLYDTNELDKSDYVFDYYLGTDAANELAMAEKEDTPEYTVGSLKDYYSMLFELEALKDEFRDFEKEAFKVLFEKLTTNELLSIAEEFSNSYLWINNLLTELAVYFINTYMCGAVYDEYIFSQTEQACFNTKMLNLLWLYTWYKNGKTIDVEKIYTILYRYCRELENSTENLVELEKLLD